LEDRGRRRLARDAVGPLEKEYAKESQALAEDPDGAAATNGAAESDLEAVVAM
jgi:hypothetical protein